ncbi:hypothetical protein FRACYDRAFT_207231 [Fragilariopsis cylindrus CCMP1102]|uniref:Nudix hydrolase domain-containing protein n=1 Tax=Fragilariopsis cylindrus CCMP1102 TaxID=635003 RepID=A0A1E7FM16_9STRA|nr:hypothetical protein FRACYDRAFT_207231 [Fragilariopsis cylindrus CCMP1102]|eukprot:OEU18853.1 hypothetical protein FRACYDRAFT_207231 [Fragilariopsis cylindrus CCMP1102]
MKHSHITSSISTHRFLSTSSTDDDSEEDTYASRHRDNIIATAAVTNVDKEMEHQRIWRPDNNSSTTDTTLYWRENVIENAHSDPHNLVSLLNRIGNQELHGGRMRDRQNGVLHEDPAVDMRLLIEQYTVNSLASALRDREEMLQMASKLAAENKFELLKEFLIDCHPDVVLERRQRLRQLDLNEPFNFARLETIRKALMRMPRQVTMGHSRRAGVVIALVHVDGVPSLLLEKRSASLRAHPDEVCLPGGMYCKKGDRTIVETCLREMKEEIGGFDFDYHRETGVTNGISVLGILRCNWGEVHHLVGVAVTPVVCFFNQDVAELDLKPNPDEVAEVFTIPLSSLLEKKNWVYKDDHAPIFVGGPYAIWGLTGYILERFMKDILVPFTSRQHHPSSLDISRPGHFGDED